MLRCCRWHPGDVACVCNRSPGPVACTQHSECFSQVACHAGLRLQADWHSPTCLTAGGTHHGADGFEACACCSTAVYMLTVLSSHRGSRAGVTGPLVKQLQLLPIACVSGNTLAGPCTPTRSWACRLLGLPHIQRSPASCAWHCHSF
jgi:hypothetical protein